MVSSLVTNHHSVKSHIIQAERSLFFWQPFLLPIAILPLSEADFPLQYRTVLPVDLNV